jgi:hypothetical protein
MVVRLPGIALTAQRTRQGQNPASFTPIPRDQPARRALAQLIKESVRTLGTRPATLPSLPPQQAAPEETVMEVTRGAADDRMPAAIGGLAAAAFVLRRREG